MGIKSITTLKRKHQLCFNEHKHEQFTLTSDPIIYVDLLGSFYNIITKHAATGDYSAIGRFLTRTFGELECVVVYVLDGGYTLAKHATHKARCETRERDLEKWTTMIKENKEMKRISKAKWKKMEKLKKRCSRLTDEVKEELQFCLQTEHELEVVIAPGEADVYIAQHGPNITAVSNDSDFLFHKVNTVYAPQVRGSMVTSWQHFTRQHSCTRLSLSPSNISFF